MEYIRAYSRNKKNREYYRAIGQLWSLCLLFVQIPGKPGGFSLWKNRKRERSREIGLNPQVGIAKGLIYLILFVGTRTITPALNALCRISFFLIPPPLPFTLAYLAAEATPTCPLPPYSSEKKNSEVWFPIYVTFIISISIYAYIHSYVHTYACMHLHKYT